VKGKDSKEGGRRVATGRAYRAYHQHEERRERKQAGRQGFNPQDERYYVSLPQRDSQQFTGCVEEQLLSLVGSLSLGQANSSQHAGYVSMGPFLLAPGVSTKTWREPPQQRAFRYLSSDKNTRRYSCQRRSSSPPPPPPASSTPPTQHSSSPLLSSSKSSPSPQPSSDTSSENRLSACPNKLEKQLAAAGEDVEGESVVRDETGLPGLPYIPDPDYATPYNPCPATPSPDYEERERHPMERDLWGNARRYRGKQESAADPTRTLKEALKNRPPVSQFIREITRATEEDRRRREERQQKQRLLENQEAEQCRENDPLGVLTELNSILEKEEKRVDLKKEENYEENNNDDAQLIYREILEVVQANATSMSSHRGRMVGYGPEVPECSLNPSGAHNGTHQAARVCRAGANSANPPRGAQPPLPPLPHGVSGPVSFSGFSPPASLLSTGSSYGHPASLQGHILPVKQKKKKKKRRWFHIFS